MNFRTTLLLLITAIGLAIYIGVYERSDVADSGDGRSSSRKTLANFDSPSISRIVIESGGTTTELKRHTIYWIFAKPISDRASAQTVNSVLDQLSHLSIQDQLRPAELINSPELSDEALGFGSDDAVRVSLFQNNAAGEEIDTPVSILILGKPAPLSNALYARVEGDPERAAQTFVVSGAPRQYLTDPIDALRDRSLLGIPTEQVIRIVVRTAGGDVEVTRKITPPQIDWTLTKPLQTRADSEMMEAFLNRLSGLQIADIVEENAPSSTLPSQIPSGSARVDINVHGWDQPVSLYLSAKPNDDDEAASDKDPQAQRLIARVSTRPGVYEIRSSLLADIPDSPAEFRDPHLARIPAQYLHRIAIVSRTDPNVRLFSENSAEGVRWYSARSGEKDRANVDKLKRMLNAINEGRVLDFIRLEPGDLEKYGLKSPELQIVFNFHPQQPVAGGAPEADTQGQQRILQFGRNTDENTLFANFVDEPWVYQVDPTIRNAIPSHPLKWRDLKVLNFNLIGLKQIELDRRGTPTLSLNYDYANDTWSGEESGAPLSPGALDINRTMLLARTLGSLNASTWITNLQTAYELLDDPDLTISITRREIDPLTNRMEPVTEKLRFSEAPVGGYYGNIVGRPDVFLIDRETYRDIVIPKVNP